MAEFDGDGNEIVLGNNTRAEGYPVLDGDGNTVVSGPPALKGGATIQATYDSDTGDITINVEAVDYVSGLDSTLEVEWREDAGSWTTVVLTLTDGTYTNTITPTAGTTVDINHGFLQGVTLEIPAAPPSSAYEYPAPSPYLFFGGTKGANAWGNTGFGPDATEPTNPPTLNVDTYEFDGVNDVLRDLASDTMPSPDTVQAVPDASGEVTGKGFACTGLTKNLRTDELIVGNHGGQGVHPDATLEPSVVTLSADGSTKVRENVLGMGDNYSVQGVVYDNTRDVYWCIAKDVDNIDTRLLQFDIDEVGGTTNANANYALDSDANGVAYNPNTDELYVLRGDTATRVVKIYDPTDGSYTGDLCTLPASSTLDMLAYDPVYNILWHSKGANASSGFIQGYSLDGDFFGDVITVTDSLAIEGFIISNNGLNLEAVSNDAWYHNGGAEVNNISFYTYDLGQQVAKLYKRYDGLELSFLGNINTATGDTDVIFAINDPVREEGFGIYKGSGSATTIRIIVHNGTTLEAEDFTLGAAWTTECIITVKADIANKTAELFQNGVSQGTVSWALAFTDFRYTAFGIGDNYNSADNRELNIDVKEMYLASEVLTNAQTNAQNQAWATEHGLSWTDIT